MAGILGLISIMGIFVVVPILWVITYIILIPTLKLGKSVGATGDYVYPTYLDRCFREIFKYIFMLGLVLIISIAYIKLL